MVQIVWNMCWIFPHMFVYQSIMLKLFLWIFRDFMGFIWELKTQFSTSEFSPARLWRSTGPVDRTQSRSTGRAQGRARSQPLGPVDWAVDRLKATHSRVAPVDRAVDWPESHCSLVLGVVDRAVDRQAQRSNFDRWSVDRMVKSDHNWLPTASFWKRL